MPNQLKKKAGKMAQVRVAKVVAKAMERNSSLSSLGTNPSTTEVLNMEQREIQQVTHFVKTDSSPYRVILSFVDSSKDNLVSPPRDLEIARILPQMWHELCGVIKNR